MVGLDALRKSDILGGLSDEELLAIAKMAREEIYDAGTVIFCENEPARDFYVVHEGRVAVLIDIGRDEQAVIGIVGRDQSFGWCALIPPYTRNSTTKTLDRTRLIVISARAFRGLSQMSCCIYCSVMEKVAALISHRLVDVRLQLLGLMKHG